jgi:arginyl-tRNA synthetase
MIKEQIIKDLAKALKTLRIPKDKIKLEHPALRRVQGKPDHGDYATNVALVTFKKRPKKLKTEAKLPLDWANKIVNTWRLSGLPEYIAKVEVAKPGFINLWLDEKALVAQLERVLKEKSRFGKSFDPELKTEGLTSLKRKKILLEHTSPNPQTTIMLGHLRNNFLGMSMAHILEFLGAKVTKDCIVNDRGIHISRAMWGYLVFGRKRTGLNKSQLLRFKKVTDSQIKKVSANADWQELIGEWTKKKSNWWRPSELGLKTDHINLIWYVLGSRAYELFPEVKDQVQEILVAWEGGEKVVKALWRQILNWSAKGYEHTYQRIGSVHDYVWYEHKLYRVGKDLVERGVKKGVFRKLPDGAVLSDLSKYELPDAILRKSDGTALYHTFDINLTKKKRKKFPSDLYIWDIGNEQILYLKQLFAMCEQLGIGKRSDYFHLNYALINLKGGGKMSTRTGDVIKADEVLDELHQRALEVIKSTDQELRGKLTKKQLDELAETVALGAIKYSLLKYARETTIYFDPEESLALEGNSGPYLQYTYARCRSVMRRAGSTKHQAPSTNIKFNLEELALLRTIYQFPEVVAEAGENYAPNLICNYLFDLAQKYNLFYNKHSILKARSQKLRNFRLALTAAVAQVLKNGLSLLGIQAPERM